MVSAWEQSEAMRVTIELSHTRECPCGNQLVAAMVKGVLTLKCPRCGPVTDIEMLPKAGASYYRKKRNHWIGGYVETTALQKMKPAQMILRVEQAKWDHQLNDREKQTLATIAITYGLDPLMKELTLYQGTPYIAIEGRRRKAQDTHELLGITTRPMNAAEREERNLAPEDFGGYAKVKRAVAGQVGEFEAYRVIRPAEIEKREAQAKARGNDASSLPIVNDPQGMVEKRAEALALKRGFNVPLPSAEDIGFEEVQPRPSLAGKTRVVSVEKPPTKAEPPVEVQDVDPATGEILSKQTAAADPVVEPPPAATAPPEATPDLQAMWKHLIELVDTKEIPRQMIANKLGEKGLSIKDWGTCPEMVSTADLQKWIKLAQSAKAKTVEPK